MVLSELLWTSQLFALRWVCDSELVAILDSLQVHSAMAIHTTSDTGLHRWVAARAPWRPRALSAEGPTISPLHHRALLRLGGVASSASSA